MILAFKSWAKRHWPALHLRSVLLATLLFAAALPGFGALFLRVYENTLVRQTEAELVAQGAALAAAAAAAWPGEQRIASPKPNYRPEPPEIDLSSADVLPERPAPSRPVSAVDVDGLSAGVALGPVMAMTAQTTLASIKLVDRNRIIVAGRDAGGQLLGLPELEAALSGRARTVVRRNGDYHASYAGEWLSRAAGVRLHHARPVVVNGRVVGVVLLSRSPRALFRGIYQDRGKILFGVVAIFGALLVMAGVLSRGIARPIDALARATRSVADGGSEVPVAPATAVIEIRDLYRNFAAMAEAIALRSQYLRNFAAAVSHEFKTPLTSIRGSVELLQDHPDMGAEQHDRFLANIKADADRLNALVTRLLELAKADMQAASNESCDVGDVLQTVADAYHGPGFVVQLELQQQPVLAACPARSLDTAISVLLDNARQAGATAASVRVNHPTEGTLELICQDNGAGIAAGDVDRVFEPFFTGRREQGGTGLGLPIARSLVEAAGGSLRLQPSKTGACFALTLLRAHPPDRLLSERP